MGTSAGSLNSAVIESGVVLWAVIFTSGLITYAIRLSFILFFSQRDIPSWLQRALRFVPPAVLSAIILPELLIQNAHLQLTFTNARLIAGIVAILVAWRTKNVLLTIAVGMLVLWLLQYFQ
jgi:branched-subunit amino acid transport protein